MVTGEMDEAVWRLRVWAGSGRGARGGVWVVFQRPWRRSSLSRNALSVEPWQTPKAVGLRVAVSNTTALCLGGVHGGGCGVGGHRLVLWSWDVLLRSVHCVQADSMHGGLGNRPWSSVGVGQALLSRLLFQEWES